MKSAKFLSGILVFTYIFIFTPWSPISAVGIPFGGRIVYTFPCLCSANFLLFIRDPRGFVLPLTYQPGVSLLYANYRVYPPVNTKGTYSPPGVCLVPGSPCYAIPSYGTIIMMGSSKI